MRSPLAPLVGSAEPRDPRRLAREAWHSDRIAMFNMEWLAPEDRTVVTAIADKIHGERRVGGK